MSSKNSKNSYAQLLKEQGNYLVNVKGIDWYEYNGFMMPAYLPHRVPEITLENAKEVLKISKKPFVRWDTNFNEIEKSEWWYVIRREPWDIQKSSGNTRSKIRRGRKKLAARLVSIPEIKKYGYEVCLKAERRYARKGIAPSKAGFDRKVEVAREFEQTFEFYGVFHQDKLVGFSENYIQDNAVFLESIWYDPDYLRLYSSYVFVAGILEYYLNQKKINYVLDGCRSIHHKTNVQDFFVNVFGFTKEYANLNVVYSNLFGTLVKTAYPFKGIVEKISEKTNNHFIANITAVLKQEYIQRTCK